MNTKLCTVCKLDKPIEDYPIIKRRGKLCTHAKCKVCFTLYYKEKNKQSYEKNINTRLLDRKNYVNTHKEDIAKQRKIFRQNNKERLKIEQQTKYANNKETYIAKAKAYYIANKAHLLSKKNERYNIRMKTDIVFKLKKNIKTLIGNSIKRNGYIKNNRTAEILGCSIDEFKTYLESKFEAWMSWENYGKYNGTFGYGWDIDHIKPLCMATNEANIIELNHYLNLQPLCSYTNRDIKRNKF